MYLGCALTAHDLPVHSPGGNGPDFWTEVEGQRVWIEAIAPERGEGNDQVPPIAYGEAYRVPEEKILLRLTNALAEKRRKFSTYIEKGIVQKGDSVVVAMNVREIPHASFGGTMPYILKALFPFGPLAAAIDRRTGELVDVHYSHRPAIRKANNVDVHTTAFLGDEYSIISGVLHSAVDCANHPPTMGGEFFVVHNPMASHPLPASAFRWCRQYRWVHDALEETPASHARKLTATTGSRSDYTASAQPIFDGPRGGRYVMTRSNRRRYL